MPDSKRDGFSLVEVTLALGISAFCLVAIFGLLPVGLNASQSAIQQTAANGILSAVISDLRATPPPTQPQGQPVISQEYLIPIPVNPLSSPPAAVTVFFNESGEKVLTAQEARYRLTVQFLPNGSSAAATFVNLKVSWPASIDPNSARPPGSVLMFTALDRNQ